MKYNFKENHKNYIKELVHLWNGKIDVFTFNVFTSCIFKKAKFTELPSLEPDYTSSFGSSYWYTDKGVFRFSDHWGNNVGSCNWFFEEENNYDHCIKYEEEILGYSDFKDFKRLFYQDYDNITHDIFKIEDSLEEKSYLKK